METAISTISALPVGKAQTESFINKLVNEITDGNNDKLKILVQLKYFEKVITETLKNERVDEAMVNAYSLYGKGEKVVIDGAELKQGEYGVKYDFNASGDVIYNDLIKEMETLKAKIKARETFLKAIPEEGAVCPVNGNYLTRPPKESHTKISVTIK